MEEASASLARSIVELRKQLSNLIDLRIRDQIGDEEFVVRRSKLEMQVKAAEEKLVKTSDGQSWLEPLASMISFSKCAVPWLLHGDEETKRIIMKTVGSNLTLFDKKVSIDKTKPFVPLAESETFSSWCARLREVRKLIVERDPETMKVIESIKMLVAKKNLTLPPFPPLQSSHPEADEETNDTD